MDDENDYGYDPLALSGRPKLPKVELQVATSIDFEPLRWVPVIEVTHEDAEQRIRDYANAILRGFNDAETPAWARQTHPELRAVTGDGLIVAEWLNINL